MNIAGQFQPYPPATATDPTSGTMSVLQLRAFFGREWRLIALATFVLTLLGIAYVASSPSRYTALTDMIIDTKRVTWVQSEMSSESRGTDNSLVESEIETTKSEKVAGAVVKRLNLTSDPEFVGSDPDSSTALSRSSGPSWQACPDWKALPRQTISLLKVSWSRVQSIRSKVICALFAWDTAITNRYPIPRSTRSRRRR